MAVPGVLMSPRAKPSAKDAQAEPGVRGALSPRPQARGPPPRLRQGHVTGGLGDPPQAPTARVLQNEGIAPTQALDPTCRVHTARVRSRWAVSTLSQECDFRRSIRSHGVQAGIPISNQLDATRALRCGSSFSL
jgi:hypothetical protein